MKTIARLAMIFCSINLFILPAFAEPKIIYAASLTDDNGPRAESSMKLQMPASESDYRLLEWYISHGVARNVIDSSPLEPKIKNFQSVFVGRSHVSKKNDLNMSYFTDYALGVDGFGLTTTKNTDAKHVFGMFRAGFRVGEHDNFFLQSGVAVTARLLPKKEPIFVNGDVLSDASVSPFVGFAIPLL